MSDHKAAIIRESRHINTFHSVITNDLFTCRIYWAKLVGSESENLFTQYTKHTFYELQYALEGRIRITIGDDLIHVAESDFVIVPPDTFHQIAGGDTIGARFIMGFTIHMKNNKHRALSDALRTAGPYRETPHMRALIPLILNKNDSDTPYLRPALTALMESFLWEIADAVLCGNTIKHEPPVPPGSPERIDTIRNYIQKYNGIGIRVSDVAEHFGYSERHLNRIVTHATGKSTKELINHEKIKRIEELVLLTHLSLREISDLCGFSDEYAMNKFFRRYNLKNLSDFRKIGGQQKTPG